MSRLPLACVALAGVIALAGCASTPAPSASPAPPATAGVIGPVVVDPLPTDGGTVTTTLGRAIDLKVPGDVTGWSATFSTPGVVTFVPGRTDATATFDPGLTPVAAGTTDVTLSGPDGQRSAFTVVVEAG